MARETDDLVFWRQAGIRALVLPPAMAAVYAVCGAWTRSAAGVPAPAFEFERHIPLLPWTVIPYLSLELLLVAAFFLCPDRRALRRLSLALMVATFLCAVGFIVSPMSLAYADTYGDGPWQPMMWGLHRVDDNYNRFPSLHVALTVLVWPVFARVRILRAAAHPWLVLVVASTLLTHQHQVMDVVGGALVAVAAAWVARRLVPGVRSGVLVGALRA